MTNTELIPAAVLMRKAVIYVRQSTQYQVMTNLESQRRQYDFVGVARQSGNVIGTTKSYGIQGQQIYRRRERLFGPTEPPGFFAVSIVTDTPAALPLASIASLEVG